MPEPGAPEPSGLEPGAPPAEVPAWGSPAPETPVTLGSTLRAAPTSIPIPTPPPASCFGCLLWLVWAAVWAVVAFLPLSVSDDIFGPLQGAHWPIFPAAAPPIGPGAIPGSDQGDQVVRVPPGSRMTLSAQEVDVAAQLPGFESTVRCFTRDSAGPWQELPAGQIPLVQSAGSADPDLKLVRLNVFRATTGELTVRCVGSEVLDLKREDPGVQRRLSLTIGAAKFLWPALVTLVLWAPVVFFTRRRAARRATQGTAPPP